MADNYIRVTVSFDKRIPSHMGILKSMGEIRKIMSDALPDEDLSSDSALIRTIIYNFAEQILGIESLVSPDDVDIKESLNQLTGQLNRFANSMQVAIRSLHDEINKIQSAPKNFFTTEIEPEAPPEGFGAFTFEDDDDE